MTRTRFTEEQIIGVPKEANASAKTADVARRYGVSEANIYNWKSKYGGLEVSVARRLRELESENAKLKRLLADTGDLTWSLQTLTRARASLLRRGCQKLTPSGAECDWRAPIVR